MISKARTDIFDVVRSVGLGLPDVEASTRYDGSPVLKLRGCFLAALATHESAECDTLVIRADPDEREWMIADAPEIYYLTDYYRKYPLLLARIPMLDRDALRDLLTVSWRLTEPKTRRRSRHERRA
jgi:hypothetical protein